MKKLRALFGLFVVVAAVYVGLRVVPIYIAKYQFEEAIDDSARMAAVNSSKTEEDLRQAVYRQAQDLKIPLQPEDIKIERSGNDVTVSADYTVHVDLPVYPLDLRFHPSSNRQSLTFR